MEYWRQCALWLINCKVLPASHRVTWESAQVFDLAQTLRDGVLLCHLLNNLRPQSINLKVINLRPQMSQFLCLKNIRTFLAACNEVFGMKKSDLFDAFDLFDVRNFGKVGKAKAPQSYNHSTLCYFLLLSCADSLHPPSLCMPAVPKDYTRDIHPYPSLLRSRCLVYAAAQHRQVISDTDSRPGVHGHLIDFSFLLQTVPTSYLQPPVQTSSFYFFLYIFYIVVLLPVPCSLTVYFIFFCLHFQELVKHTHDTADKSNLRKALDAMKDLAQYVNEVKRDNETLREIDQYQKSIENLNQSLRNYGRPKGDGEVRVASVDRRAKQDRHIFLFDAAVIVCKRRGDNYEMKEVIDLHLFKITNNPTSDKENRKWSYGFYLTHNQGQSGFEFFFKTKELKKKWLEQFGMAISNIRPENAADNFHEFRMHTFDRITSCNSCHMLLRGIFNQGYLCSKCGLGAHKECLGRFGSCGKTGRFVACRNHLRIQRTHKNHCRHSLPKMLAVTNYSGDPSPASGPALYIQTGDIIELICADLQSRWWQGRILETKDVGFFPSEAVRPCPCVPKPVDFSSQPWFAGPMERLQAEAELINRVNSTYLVRHRSKEYTEYAISIKYNNDVKHIKILTKDGCYYIAENKKFRSILELIEYYKHHSLREGFKSLDTTLQFPYRQAENAAVHRLNRSGGNMLTPKVIGVAIARYDFSSRDTRELSLQEGDVVKIYTKTGANGWWRGEVNGRVSRRARKRIAPLQLQVS
uniref:Guanine nucleotide exchange factor VAV3 n=1 Tax=Oryzias sinensis TaxID=183150 RepID=A0A8C8E1N2_9TELE